MKQVDITICRADDGTYSAYCNEHPALFGMGDSPEQAKSELLETLRLTKDGLTKRTRKSKNTRWQKTAPQKTLSLILGLNVRGPNNQDRKRRTSAINGFLKTYTAVTDSSMSCRYASVR